MKKRNYFYHPINLHRDERIIALRMKYGMEGYGLYLMLLERFGDFNNYMSIRNYDVIAFELHTNAEKVRSVIEDFKLFKFTEDGKYFYSELIMQQMKMKDLKSAKAREAANARWNKEELKMQCEQNEQSKNEYENYLNGMNLSYFIIKFSKN